MKRTSLVMLLLLTTAAGACKKVETGTVATTGTTGATSTSPTVATDPVLATVNKMEIRQSEFDIALASVPENMRMSLASVPARRELLDELIKMKLLESEARRLGVEKDPAVASRVSMATGNILANAAIEKLATQPVADAELRALYAKNQKEFEGLKVSQLTIAYAGGAVPSAKGKTLSPAAAKARAQSLVRRIRAGESFETIARAESDDRQSAAQGGDMGVVTRGMMPPELEQSLFSLPEGSVSEPIQSRFGFHIFKVTGRATKTLEESRPLLEREGKRDRVQKIIADLRQKATVKFEAAAPGGAALSPFPPRGAAGSGAVAPPATSPAPPQ
ncbi:MAG TPA: peptidylprolyl isomerase [Thermoanaerobaculia bacterium]|nr:peptidylprolyl isomerase [Thermoanaerobaculia bacterium]